MTRPLAVFDASVIVRGLVAREPTALDWLRRAEARQVDAIVPELVYAECANAFGRYVRGGVLSPVAAVERIELVRKLRLDARTLAPLVGAALALALQRSVSAYDGCYLALAEAESALLVTADSRLAAASPNAELIQ